MVGTIFWDGLHAVMFFWVEYLCLHYSTVVLLFLYSFANFLPNWFHIYLISDIVNFNSSSDQENSFKTRGKKLSRSYDFEILDAALTELFMCPKCTKTYRLKHSLTRHIKFECGLEPKYACEFCDRRFKHKYDLNVHEKSKHCGENTRYKEP